MPGSAVILTERDAQVLSALIADYRAKRPYVKPLRGKTHMPLPQVLRYAELTAALAVATNTKTGETTATAKFLKHNSSGDLVDGETFTVTNRSTDLSASSGDFCIVCRMTNKEWHIIAIDC